MFDAWKFVDEHVQVYAQDWSHLAIVFAKYLVYHETFRVLSLSQQKFELQQTFNEMLIYLRDKVNELPFSFPWIKVENAIEGKSLNMFKLIASIADFE